MHICNKFAKTKLVCYAYFKFITKQYPYHVKTIKISYVLFKTGIKRVEY